MNHEAIKTFLLLAETKNFTRTAEILYISQPSVTARIRALEEELGQELFFRTSKTVEMTAAGKFFFPLAEHLYQEHINCVRRLQDYERSNRIVISAAGTSWDYGPLRASVLNYCSGHPQMQFAFLRNISRTTLTKLSMGEVDLGVSYLPPSSPDLEYVPYIEEDLLLVSSPTTAPKERVALDKKTIPSLTIIRPLYADAVSHLMDESFSMLPSTISSDHPALYASLVKRGLGAGLLQRSIAENMLKSGELVEVNCDYNLNPMPYKNYLVFRKDKTLMLQNLIDTLCKDAEALSHKPHL